MLKPVLSGLALLLISYQAVAQPQLELALSQFLDSNCRGSERLEPTVAEPGQCIRYELKISNRGSSAAQAIQLNLPVPRHTVLKQSLVGVSLALPAQLQTSASGEQVLAAQLERLEANQQLILHYSVQVL